MKDLVISVRDDFGYKRDIKYKLPNHIEKRFENEYFNETLYGVIKDKIIMRMVDFQNYEIMFDENLNYKIKAVTPKNNVFKLSVRYSGYEIQK